MNIRLLVMLLSLLLCVVAPAGATVDIHDVLHDLGHQEIRDGATQTNSPNVQIIVLDFTFIMNGGSWESSYSAVQSSDDDYGWIADILTAFGL